MKKIKRKYSKKNNKILIKRKGFWFVLIPLIPFLSFFYIIFSNPFYQLEGIDVLGANLTSEHSLKEVVRQNTSIDFIFDSNSLFFLNTGKMENKISSSLPHVKEVRVVKEFPNGIKVFIQERQKRAVWCVEKKCFDIDSAGILFRKDNIEKEDFIIYDESYKIVGLGERPIPEEYIRFIFKAKERLEDRIDSSIKKSIIPYKNSVFMYLEEGFKIKLTFRDNLEDQLERLDLLLSKDIEDVEELEYIDLRYGNRVFYK